MELDFRHATSSLYELNITLAMSHVWLIQTSLQVDTDRSIMVNDELIALKIMSFISVTISRMADFGLLPTTVSSILDTLNNWKLAFCLVFILENRKM